MSIQDSRTAVLYVHGMGSQKRLQDSSDIISALADFAQVTGRADLRGTLDDVSTQLEQFGDDRTRTATRVDVRWTPEGSSTSYLYHVYEAYWAHITAEGMPFRLVLGWMFRQVPKPVFMLRTPWRHLGRVRRSRLLDVPANPAVRSELFALYSSFDEPPARARHPGGSFKDFLRWVRDRGTPAGIDQAERAARAWRANNRSTELRNLGVLTTLAVAICTVALLLLATILGVISYVPDRASGSDDVFEFAVDNYDLVLLAVGVLGVLLPSARGFFTAYLADVAFWVTYEETDVRHQRRREILACASDALRHVASREDVDRVVVVAHSLGTSVAMEAILGVARDNRALRWTTRNEADANLRKISHFVTYGCPIDKIQYFFESSGEQRYHYRRLVEELRGDLGTEPFAVRDPGGVRRHAHWINLWDRADIISGSVESPVNRLHPELVVDNVEVQSDRIPNPLAAHSSYLRKDRVLQVLAETIFLRRIGATAGPIPAATANPVNGGLLDQLQGTAIDGGSRWTTPLQVGAAILIWVVFIAVATIAALAAITGDLIYLRLLAGITVALAGFAIASVVLGWWVRRSFSGAAAATWSHPDGETIGPAGS